MRRYTYEEVRHIERLASFVQDSHGWEELQ